MKCPHCLHSYHDQFNATHIGLGGSSEDVQNWYSKHEVCPECHKSIIFIEQSNVYNTALKSTLVYPKGISRNPIPTEVDDTSIVEDYTEACLVLGDSPKASAALSRRCLQHILREKAGVKKSDLNAEIQEILNKNILSSDIAENLDAVRNIGNFAAHPTKSKSTGEIVDVESEEAEWNLEVLEQLIDFYYVKPAIAKKKREELNAKLAAAGKPLLK